MIESDGNSYKCSYFRVPDSMPKTNLTQRLREALAYLEKDLKAVELVKSCQLSKNDVKQYLQKLCKQADPDMELFKKVCKQSNDGPKKGQGGISGKKDRKGAKGGNGGKRKMVENGNFDDFEKGLKNWHGLKNGICFGQNLKNDWFWRQEGCLIKMGQFCELTGAYHWKNVASCQSCANCAAKPYKNW